MNERTYEFETSCEATVHETWRITVPGDLAGNELVQRIEEELQAGRCDFISEKAEEERERDVQEHTVEEAAPEPEPAYTVTGYGDNNAAKPYIVTVYTHHGPEAARTLARAAYAEGEGEGELQVIAVFAGKARLIDFDEPRTWPK